MGAYGAEQIAAADLSSDGPTQRSGEDRKGAAEQRSEGRRRAELPTPRATKDPHNAAKRRAVTQPTRRARTPDRARRCVRAPPREQRRGQRPDGRAVQHIDAQAGPDHMRGGAGKRSLPDRARRCPAGHPAIDASSAAARRGSATSSPSAASAARSAMRVRWPASAERRRPSPPGRVRRKRGREPGEPSFAWQQHQRGGRASNSSAVPDGPPTSARRSPPACTPARSLGVGRDGACSAGVLPRRVPTDAAESRRAMLLAPASRSASISQSSPAASGCRAPRLGRSPPEATPDPTTRASASPARARARARAPQARTSASSIAMCRSSTVPRCSGPG